MTSPWNQFPTSWAPDARHLAFTEFQPLTGADIWVLDVQTRERRPLVRTLFDETWARFSPDGRVDRLHVERIRAMGSLRATSQVASRPKAATADLA